MSKGRAGAMGCLAFVLGVWAAGAWAGEAPTPPEAEMDAATGAMAAEMDAGLRGLLGIEGGEKGEAKEDSGRAHPKRLRDYHLSGLETSVNFSSLKPMDVVQLIEFLAYRGGLNNIVIGKEVTGLTAKLKFDNVSVADALEVVLSVNRLAYEVRGGILTIMTDAEYQAQYGASFYDQKTVEIVDLKYADAGRVAGMLGSLRSAIGTVVADPVTGTLILIDTPERIREMKAVVAKADIATLARVVPTETRHFTMQYGDVEEVYREVSSLLTKDVGSARMDKRTRTLIVTDLPHQMAKARDLIALFDRPAKQVFIEAKVVETALSDDFSMGINWQHVFNGLDPRFMARSVSQPGRIATPAGMLSFNTAVLGGDLEAVLEALKEVGDVKILSNPHIAVMDGHEAAIEVVTDQPYKEVTMESGTTNITGVTYLFKQVGVQLTVTPRINDEAFISVAIKPTISSISQWYDGGPQEGTPVIKKAFAETTVMVKDGVTIIIGGMIQDRKDTSTKKVPILGSIPLIGRLFRYDTVSSRNTETVVFMTPRIMTGEEPITRLKYLEKEPKPMKGGDGVETKGARPLR